MQSSAWKLPGLEDRWKSWGHALVSPAVEGIPVSPKLLSLEFQPEEDVTYGSEFISLRVFVVNSKSEKSAFIEDNNTSVCSMMTFHYTSEKGIGEIP